MSTKLIQVDALIRTKRKTISISISPQGNVVVRAPQNCPMSYIETILKKREQWIILHKQRVLSRSNINQNLFTFREILFCGMTYTVSLSNSVKSPTLYGESFFIPFKTKPDRVPKVLEKWLRSCAESIIQQRLNYFANLMQLAPLGFRLGNTKSSWGSCSKSNIITINWRCVMLPPNLLDYVVVHELSHMLEFNHSHAFWEIVRSILPDVKYRKSELKKGDYLLELYRR